MAYGYNPQQNYPMQQAPPAQGMQSQNIQPLFPQPQGNVYNINSTLEVANVPVGAGISVALCLPENTMFIKTMQNGNPLFYPYKILPYSNEVEQTTQSATTPQSDSIDDLVAQVRSCTDRITAVEEVLKNQKKGVNFEV